LIVDVANTEDEESSPEKSDEYDPFTEA